MRNMSLLVLLLAVGFVGATSCGFDNSSQTSDLQAQNMALRQVLAEKSAQTNSSPTVTMVATAISNVTVTQVSGSTATNNGTTVVYTVTNHAVGTAIKANTRK